MSRVDLQREVENSQVLVTAGHFAGCSGTVVAAPPEGWEWWTIRVTPVWPGDPVELCLYEQEFEFTHGG